MATEALKYSVRIETRRGPFGLIRGRKKEEDLSVGESRFLTFGGGHELGLALEPESQALIIRSRDPKPYVVEFAAEQQRFRGKVRMLFGGEAGKGEIRTGRRAITVYPEGDPMHRVILKAPRFQPLTLTPGQVAGMKKRYKGNPAYYNDPDNFEGLFARK